MMLDGNDHPGLDLDEIYAFAIEVGKGAGKILLEVFQARCRGSINGKIAHTEKENAVDLVTQTDEGKIISLRTSAIKPKRCCFNLSRIILLIHVWRDSYPWVPKILQTLEDPASKHGTLPPKHLQEDN